MIREELQRNKLRGRVGRRAWRFKEWLAEGRGSELARKCWEEIKKRAKRGEFIGLGAAKTGIF